MKPIRSNSGLPLTFWGLTVMPAASGVVSARTFGTPSTSTMALEHSPSRL